MAIWSEAQRLVQLASAHGSSHPAASQNELQVDTSDRHSHSPPPGRVQVRKALPTEHGMITTAASRASALGPPSVAVASVLAASDSIDDGLSWSAVASA